MILTAGQRPGTLGDLIHGAPDSTRRTKDACADRKCHDSKNEYNDSDVSPYLGECGTERDRGPEDPIRIGIDADGVERVVRNLLQPSLV